MVGRRYVLGGRVCTDAGERSGRGLVRTAMASRRRHNCSNSAQPIGRQSNRSPQSQIHQLHQRGLTVWYSPNRLLLDEDIWLFVEGFVSALRSISTV